MYTALGKWFILLGFILPLLIFDSSTTAVANSPAGTKHLYFSVKEFGNDLGWLNFDNIHDFKTFPIPHHIYKKWPSLSLIQKIPYLIDRNYLINAKEDYIKLCQAAISHQSSLDYRVILSTEDPTAITVNVEEGKSVDITKFLKPVTSTQQQTTSTVEYVKESNTPQMELEDRQSETKQETTKPSPESETIFCDEKITLQTFLNLLQDFQNTKDIEKFFRDCDSMWYNMPGDSYIEWGEYVLCRGYYDRNGRPFDISEFDFLENIVLTDYRTMLNDPRNPMVLDLIARGEEL